MSHLQTTLFSLLLIALILLAAFFACAETALMALNRYRLRHQARLRKRYAMQLLKMLKRPDRLLGAILIGSTFANMLASSLATLIAFHFWGDKGAFVAVVVLTFFVLIFAEIAPKTVAAIYPDQVSRWVAYPIKYILQLLYPVVWLANAIANRVIRLFRIRVTNYAVEPLSHEELRSVVYDTAGKISRRYQNMLLGILDLNKLTVDDVMIPRHNIVGIDMDKPWNVVIEQLRHFQQDWIPFYRENVNQVIGVLYTQNILPLLGTDTKLDKEGLQQLLQAAYFVPEGTALHLQLKYFQRSRDKVAFVVDEYGEIQGLLTLNDILEEIIGDFSVKTPLTQRLQKKADGSYLVDGALTVREFNRTSGWELPQDGPKTVNGLITESLEMLPRMQLCVLIAGYPIEVLRVKDNRVKEARIFPRLKGKFNSSTHT